ncbi:MAG: hypothetical protein K6F64_03745 [Clostridia bacterium]|nr:hypothetical protein [Clostridia bacterium]
MKSSEQMTRDVFEKIDEYKILKKKRTSVAVKTVSAALVIISVITGGAVFMKGRLPAKKTGGEETALPSAVTEKVTAAETVTDYESGGISAPRTETYAGHTVFENAEQDLPTVTTPAIIPSTAVLTTSKANRPPATEAEVSTVTGTTKRPVDAGSEGHSPFIPAMPSDKTIKITGEELTDEEAAAYFKKNRVSLSNSLNASGVQADSLEIKPHGYCHVMYSGQEGESFELRQNFRDYLAYSNGKLVAIITLVKENGQLYSTPAFGAPWFETFDQQLKNRKGQELVFVYSASLEVVLTPDGGYFMPSGIEIGLELPENMYELCYNEKAVYVP